MKGTILLSDVVKDILLKTRTPSSEYFRYLSLAIEAITQIGLHVVSYPKQTKITMSDSGIVPWPDDMVHFISIGASYKGKLWTYTYKDEMITTTEEEDGVTVPEVELDRERFGYGAAVRGGKNTHYFKIDYPNRRIFVMGFPQQDAYLTYTSTGVSLTEPTLIPLEMSPVIRAYVKWEDSKYDSDIPFHQKHLNEQNFHQQRRLLESLRWPSVDQWADIIRKTYTRTVIR